MFLYSDRPYVRWNYPYPKPMSLQATVSNQHNNIKFTAWGIDKVICHWNLTGWMPWHSNHPLQVSPVLMHFAHEKPEMKLWNIIFSTPYPLNIITLRQSYLINILSVHATYKNWDIWRFPLTSCSWDNCEICISQVYFLCW